MGEERRLRDLWAEARELSLGTSGCVDRLDAPPSPLRFLRDYVSANKPCLISRAATRGWPAVSLWSDDAYLRRALRGHAVSVHLTPHGRADSLVPLPSARGRGGGLCFASAAVRSMDFSEALELITATGSPSSPTVAYAQQQNDCFRAEYSALAGDVEPDVPWATEALGRLPEAVNLWIGNGRSETSFHKDHYENLYAVITGEKHFLLLPPTDVHRLYVRHYPAAHYVLDDGGELRLELEQPERQVPWCSVDPYPETAEALAEQREAFPLYFDGPKPFECTVKAGEILYLPSMWFHHVRQTPDRHGRTIAVNYWYDMQFDIKYAYFSFLQSIDYTLPPCKPSAKV
ncbi:bifunctional peptidase and (3S)-lysyl hydroxylase Jmjd7 [Phoenix dactylifera]|uniref:Bifunctional peptidase and (3S)-lysyl hydroxylase Jmjd7 n=1 Tax=Phoenix dactylifera TaxID=42345 RepID=A0A8B7CFE8_PHODC|nr:bifunctional peptidase and (3S)-lysyl hydroxylase Jmjd7 [Phoenix dactylifera]